MTATTTTILLTGFGAFPGVPDNATARLVPELAALARARWPELAVVEAILPVEWDASPARLGTLIALHAPRLSLHFGVSGQARGIVLETLAANVCRPSPDAAGRLPPLDYLSADGPAALPASFPALLTRDRLAARAIPAELSQDAGGYLCNAILHTSLCCATPGALAGFIHLPANLGAPECPLSWDAALEAGLVAIEAGLEDGGREHRGFAPMTPPKA